jgi:hypothetical protein
MEEVCIVIDPNDKALEPGSKRKCTLGWLCALPLRLRHLPLRNKMTQYVLGAFWLSGVCRSHG